MNARIVSLVAAVFLLVLSAFGAGMWATHKNWWAWRTTDDVSRLWRSWRDTGQILRDMTYARRQPSVSDTRYRVADPARIAKGSLLVMRFDPASQLPVADLIDAGGTTVHSWPIDYSRMVQGGARDEFPHAVQILPDGSLLVDFDDGRALARIDACGDPIWARTDRVYHHLISKGTDGYWVWADPSWDGGVNQSLVRFDPETGAIREEISLLDDIVPATPSGGTVFSLTDGYKIARMADPEVSNDVLHPNDVEELTPELAAAFPQFNAGDLLISMRNINLVAVIDRKTYRVKWARYGPWRDQHDPDFEPDGTISVFSNNMERNRSTLISIDPRTGAWRDLFQGKDFWFSSYIMGTQDRLPNGNRLIATPMDGRVVEVTQSGEVVREFSNIIDDTYNSILSSAQFVPDGYLEALPTCAK